MRLSTRYEPILLTLLKRREATAVALLKAKEQGRELKAQLGPLKEETQKLNLQRACLEEKLKLLHFQRREEVGQYKVSEYETDLFTRASVTPTHKALKMSLSYRRRFPAWRTAAES